MTKFKIHHNPNKGIWVTPNGGNGAVQPGETIQWTCSQAQFKLQLHDGFGDPGVSWSSVFSTTEPAWDVSTCEGTIKPDFAGYFKYDIIIQQDVLDPVIIVGGKKRLRLVQILFAIGVAIVGGVFGYLLAS